MATGSRVHWLAPASMLGTFLCGILLGMGHHLFYKHLDGTVVTGPNYSAFGSSIPRQEANIAIGTAFASLVKACLVFATSVAFLQLFWREAKALNGRAASTLASLDSLHSVLAHISVLFNPWIWRKYPLLLLIATAAWLIPLASIVSPATLSVEYKDPHPPPVRSMRVPNVDFKSLSFLSPVTFQQLGFPGHAMYLYNGPRGAVLRIASAAMSLGAILPMPFSIANASWELEFYGPALRCGNVSDETYALFQSNIANALASGGEDENLYGYIAWATSRWVKPEATTPFEHAKQNNFSRKPVELRPAALNPGKDINANYDIYVMAMPAMFNVTANDISLFTNTTEPARNHIKALVNGPILQCRLYNSTYHVTFDFVNGNQTVTIDTPLSNFTLVSDSGTWIDGPDPYSARLHSCHADKWSGRPRYECVNNAESLEILSYRAILDAFLQNVLGYVSTNFLGWTFRHTSVLNTALASTPDLSFLGWAAGDSAEGMYGKNFTLQNTVEGGESAAWQGLVNNNDTIVELPLARAIEEMFKNVTVSMMSSSALQPNYSSSLAPPPAQVTIKTHYNIYVYSPTKLWVAYGIAIAITGMIVLCGLITMIRTGVSFSHKLSSILRAAKGTDISIKDKDLGGEGPLPAYLAQTEVKLGM